MVRERVQRKRRGMKRTTWSKVDEAPASQAKHPARSARSLLLALASEGIFVATVLLLAAALRLTLASRGWPFSNSDEATTGLMVDDIIRHGAHPFFTYGEHHVGSLDTYLQVPVFLLFGLTNFALHITTTIQMLLFLLVFYGFTRIVYSPLVAGATLALLAFGPYQQLFYGLRAGHYAQDMLLLSALLMYLVVLRLRRPARAWIKWTLDPGIGLVAGLALWSTILLLPFVLAAALALGVEAYRFRRAAPSLFRQALLTLSGGIIGLLPFFITAVITRGTIFIEALQAAGGTDPSLPAGPVGLLLSFGQQISATFLFGLPQMLGRATVCAQCPFWPYPGSTLAPAEALRVALISAPFSLLATGGWFLAAWPLMRSARAAFSRVRRVEPTASLIENTYQRARQWGRAMLVIGLGLTVLQYVITRSSYENSPTSIRYISNIYLCIPLIADPLCQGALPLWRWLNARVRRLALPTRPHASALLALALLLALFAINITGAVNALQETGNIQQYGVPAGQRNTQLISFLETHHATRLYTTWWVCYRLMFASQEHLDCYIVSDTDAFAPGHFNRVPAYAAAVTATPHPAYVFDLTTSEVDRSVPQHLTSLIASKAPRFTGYTSAMIGGYIVFYYASPQVRTCSPKRAPPLALTT
jgi:hypothetical protein